MKVFFISLFIFIISHGLSSAQDLLTPPPIPYSKQFDIKDLLKDIFSKKKKSLDTAELKPTQKLQYSILPGVAYNPATSVIAGISASLSWYYGEPTNTTNSSVSGSVSYSIIKPVKDFGSI